MCCNVYCPGIDRNRCETSPCLFVAEDTVWTYNAVLILSTSSGWSVLLVRVLNRNKFNFRLRVVAFFGVFFS